MADLEALQAETAELRALIDTLRENQLGHARWLADIQAGIADLHSAHAHLADLQAALAEMRSGHDAQLADLDAGIADLQSGHGAQLADLGRWLNSAVVVLNGLSTTPVLPSPELQAGQPQATRANEVDTLRRQLSVWAVMRWLAATTEESDRLISVVLPTRNRAGLVLDAIRSVLGQHHQRLELLVIDDGSSDATPDVLNSLDEPRIRTFRTSGVGGAASRNIGVDAATGSVIAFLDDDNRMDPGWLHAVAWAFDHWPATDILYGARIIEDTSAQNSEPSGDMPSIEFEPFDRRRLEQANYIDMNTIALRAGLGYRFDEELRSSIDWQLVLDVTGSHTPLELPVIACMYGCYAPDRICDHPERLEHNRRVRARSHRSRPLRVLSYNAMFPVISETYIHEEMSALAAQGASIAFASAQTSVSPFPLAEPVFADLPQAVLDCNPDLLFLYWADHAVAVLDTVERIGRPFALRPHSFDAMDDVHKVAAHPLCLGVWAYPEHTVNVRGAHPLVPIFGSAELMPSPATIRDAVISVSACLPKKDWSTLFEAFDLVPDLDRHIVIGRTNGLEHPPRRNSARGSPPRPASDGLGEHVAPRGVELLARTSVVLYTVEPASDGSADVDHRRPVRRRMRCSSRPGGSSRCRRPRLPGLSNGSQHRGPHPRSHGRGARRRRGARAERAWGLARYADPALPAASTRKLPKP